MIHSINRGSRELEFSVYGEGTPLLIIGFGTHTYRLVSERLKSKCQFILHNFYGLNKPGIDFDLSIENLMDDITYILDYLKIENVNILGHSSAGTVALDYTLNNKLRINKLFMICSPIIYDNDYFKLQQENQRKNLVGERKRVFDQNMKRFETRKKRNKIKDFFKEYNLIQIPLYFHDFNFNSPDYWEGITVNPEFINSFISKTYEIYIRTGGIDTVKDKLVSFLGKYDFATPVDSWKPYLNNSNVHIFTNSSHHPMLEESEKFDQKVIDSLGITASDN